MNCSRKIKGNYCAYCGQKAILHMDPTLHDVVHEGVHEFLHVDNKIFNTLKKLLFAPGFLTKEFLSGRRSRYIQPIRLYLTLSVIYFVLSALIESHTVKVSYSQGLEKGAAIGKTLRKEVLHKDENPIGLKKEFLEKSILMLEKDPEAFNEKLNHNFPKMLFALVPLFSLLVWLSFFRKKIKLIPCFYYSLHFHSAAFAGLILFLPLTFFGSAGDSLQLLWFAWLFWYMAKSLCTIWDDTKKTSYIRAASVLSVYGVTFALGLATLIGYQLYILAPH